MSLVYLIRHGQASSSGPTYDKLAPRGHEQAALLGQALAARGITPTRAFAGTLVRHHETARTCLTALGSPLSAESLADLNEYDHEAILRAGPLANGAPLSLTGEAARDPSARHAFARAFEAAMERWASGLHDGDYRESWSAFTARCRRGFERVCEAARTEQTTLVFTSGGVIGAICMSVLGLSPTHALKLHTRLVNAGATKIVVSQTGLFLSTLNEHSHLEGREPGLITYR